MHRKNPDKEPLLHKYDVPNESGNSYDVQFAPETVTVIDDTNNKSGNSYGTFKEPAQVFNNELFAKIAKQCDYKTISTLVQTSKGIHEIIENTKCNFSIPKKISKKEENNPEEGETNKEITTTYSEIRKYLNKRRPYKERIENIENSVEVKYFFFRPRSDNSEPVPKAPALIRAGGSAVCLLAAPVLMIYGHCDPSSLLCLLGAGSELAGIAGGGATFCGQWKAGKKYNERDQIKTEIENLPAPLEMRK